MPYPPPLPPATRTDATVMATNHPADHNLISAALTEILNHIAQVETSLYPIGTITMCGAGIAPGNHEFCRGQLLSKTTYPEVFALIGTTYGPGDASNFTMPSFQGRSPMGMYPGGGWAATLGLSLGSQDSTLPAHVHNIAHQHGVNIYSSYDGDHNHYSSGDPAVNLIGAKTPGTGMQAGPGGPDINYYTFTSLNGNHRHATNGSTDGGPTNSVSAGSAPTNTNIHPSTVVNFAMRMH